MSFFAERPRASQLREWHLETRVAVDEHELKMLDLIAQNLPVPVAILGMTLEEVTVHFEDTRRELELLRVGGVAHPLFESLDDRKKENLLEVIRRYAELGLQPIITLIDSDLPTRAGKQGSVFDESEVVLRLHDESEQGRLFKMAAW